MTRRMVFVGIVVSVLIFVVCLTCPAQRPAPVPDRSQGSVYPNLWIGIVKAPLQKEGNFTMMLIQDFSNRMVEVTPKTQFIKEESADVSELAVGDRITVQGIPTVLSVGEARIGAQDLNREILPQPPPIPATPPGPPGMMPGPAPKPIKAETMTVAGKVTSLKPLKIKTEDGVTIQLAMDPDVRVTRLVPATRAQLSLDVDVLVQLDPARENPTALIVQFGKFPYSTREALYRFQIIKHKLRETAPAK